MLLGALIRTSLLTAAVDSFAVLLLAMQEYPEPARRRDRFLIQAAWSETSDMDVSERVSRARMHVRVALW